MVTVGRQPLTPIDTAYMDSEGLTVATAPHAPLEEHSKQLAAKLKMADEAVDVARAKALGKSREQFNQPRIEEKLLSGEMVRYFRRLTARRGSSSTCGALSLILSFSLILAFFIAHTLIHWLSYTMRKQRWYQNLPHRAVERHTTAPSAYWFDEK